MIMMEITCHHGALYGRCPTVRPLHCHFPFLDSRPAVFCCRRRQVCVVVNLDGIRSVLRREVNKVNAFCCRGCDRTTQACRVVCLWSHWEAKIFAWGQTKLISDNRYYKLESRLCRLAAALTNCFQSWCRQRAVSLNECQHLSSLLQWHPLFESKQFQEQLWLCGFCLWKQSTRK